MNFEGKVVLITGASSGIGADAARSFARLGAKVAIVGRNENRLNQVANQLKRADSPLSIVADVTKDAERIVNDTINHFGQLDVLVNNAGISLGDDTISLQISELDRVFDTNVRSVITLTKLCVPYLEKSKGNIVNVSSIAGLKAITNRTSYCVSKAALDQFTKCASLDLAPKGIRVNAINPAVINTPIFQTGGLTEENIAKLYEYVEKTYPVGRVGEVCDTSAAITFLADNQSASFLTGILLPVDGGAMVAGEGLRKVEI